MKPQENDSRVRLGGLVDSASVTLRVAGKTLDPDDFSKQVGVRASYEHRAGDLVSSRTETRRREGIWMLDSDLPTTAAVEDHVARVLSHIPDSMAWNRITQEFKVDLVCSVVVASANRGFVLPVAAMRELAARQIEVSIEIWVQDPED